MGRNARTLWERLDLGYFHRLPRYRTWKRWLAVSLALGAAGWVSLSAVNNDRTPYASGQMSSAHAMLEQDCQQCHTASWNGVSALLSPQEADRTMNRACLVCHGGSIGYMEETVASWHQSDSRDVVNDPHPACAHCHAEHQGFKSLAVVSDDRCTHCHEDLSAVFSSTQYDKEVSHFVSDHPEFRLISEKRRDPGTLKFNHKVHMEPDRKGPNGPVQMTCADCHRAGRSATDWRFAKDTLHVDDRLAETPSEPDLQGDFMAPIQFALHCAGCHGLAAKRVAPLNEEIKPPEDHDVAATIPHDTPAAVRARLRGLLTAHIQMYPEKAAEPVQTGGRTARPTHQKTPKEKERLALAWVDSELKLLERRIYTDKNNVCNTCHEQSPPHADGELPAIVNPAIPRRWYRSASFSHERHRVIDCTECHQQVSTSKLTSDVLLPGIDTCRTCHAQRSGNGAEASGGANFDCVLCHSYHRPPAAGTQSPGRSIRELIGGVGAE